MKFVCSILILAGVFALNDAFPSSDDHMRLAKDKLILEDLKLIADNRDASSSAACSSQYLADLTEVLATYNAALKGCEDAAQNAIDALNKDASEKIKEFMSTVSATCSIECSSSPLPGDGLDCLEQETSQSSRNLSAVSVSASTTRVALLKSIDDTKGIKDVCDQGCFKNYSESSQTVEDTFKKCAQSKEA